MDGADGFIALLDSTLAPGFPSEILPRALWAFLAILFDEFVLLLAFVVVMIALIPFTGVFSLVRGLNTDIAAAEAAKVRGVRTIADAELAATELAAAAARRLLLG